MKLVPFIIVIAVILSLGAVISYFMTEGFIVTLEQATARMGSMTGKGINTDTTCMAFNTCSTCTDDTKHPGAQCGWCPAAKACIPRSGMYRIIPSWLIVIINKDPTKDCIASEFKYSKGQCSDDTCSDYTDCRDCAGSLACGWCPTSNKCLSKAAVAAAEAAANKGSPDQGSPNQGSPNQGSPPPPLCASSLVVQSGTCPPPVCSTITDCFQCTNTTGCGFCRDTSRCIFIDGNGSSLGGSSGSTGCAQGSIFKQPYQCPCSTISKCADCANRPGCGYCKSSKKCVNLYASSKIAGGGMYPAKADCNVDDVATSAVQCAPGAKLGGVERITPTYKGDKPTAAEIAMAGNSGLLGGNELNAPGNYPGPKGTGAGAVSPPPTSKYVTGNGVVRLFGDKKGPPSATNATGLGEAPLDAYVKMLVTSELAAQGIPTNEPFAGK